MVYKGRVRTLRRRGSIRGAGRRSRRGGSDATSRAAGVRFVEIPLRDGQPPLYDISDMYKEVLFHAERPPLILKVNFESMKKASGDISCGTLVSVNHSIGYVTKESMSNTFTIMTRREGKDDKNEYKKDELKAHISAFAECTDHDMLSTVMKEALKTTHFAILLVNGGDIREPFNTEEQQAIIDILRQVHAVKATKDDTDAPVSPGSHIIYVPVHQASAIPPPVNPSTPTYLVPETQPIPVTITLPGVPFFQLTDDFTHANLGTKFFCMGVYGEVLHGRGRDNGFDRETDCAQPVHTCRHGRDSV